MAINGNNPIKVKFDDDGTKRLINPNTGITKVFNPDGSICKYKGNELIKTKEADPNIKRDLWKDGTEIKRFIKEKFEIRKNERLGEKQSGLLTDKGEFIPLLKKHLNAETLDIAESLKVSFSKIAEALNKVH